MSSGTASPLKPPLVRYIISYITLLVVPIIITGFFVFGSFSRLFSLQRFDMASYQLSNIQEEIDTKFLRIIETAFQISSSEIYRPVSALQDPMRVRTIQEDLRLKSTASPELIDILVLYDESNVFIGNFSTYRSDYLPAAYRYPAWPIEAMMRDLSQRTRPFVRPAEDVFLAGAITPTNEGAPHRVITYAMPMPIYSAQPIGWLVFLISESSLIDQLSSANMNEEALWVIRDEAGQVILSWGNRDETLDTDLEIITSQLRPTDTTETELIGDRYLIFGRQSQRSSLRYDTYVLREELLRPLRAIQRNAAIVVGVILLIGSVLIYFFMYLNYRPIRRLVQFAGENLPLQKSTLYAVDTIRESIGQIVEQNDSLRTRLLENQEAVKESIILRVLEGHVDSLDDFNAIGATAGLYLPSSMIAIALARFSAQDPSLPIPKRLILDTLEHSFSDAFQCFGRINAFDDRIVLLLNADEAITETLRNDISRVMISVQRLYNIEYSVGVGRFYDSMPYARQSYIEACEALDYRLIKGDQSIIEYSESFTDGVDRPQEEVTALLRQLDLALRKHDSNEVERSIGGITTLLRSGNVALQYARRICFEIITTVIRAVDSIDTTLADLEYPDFLKLSSFATIDELEKSITSVCRDICAHLNANQKSLYSRLLQHIEANFLNPNFSLQMLSDEFELTQSNISRLFKSHKGINISNHIAELRIRKANDLLENTDMTQREVVEAVGYHDVSSFIRKYREIQGITPGQYRKVAKKR